ncbi:MAG: DUF1080 domain-containing protein [Planctomycetota bacterium]|nr:MAG: DUF1080 domain-containing protein [Planctomycetota bacterium]
MPRRPLRHVFRRANHTENGRRPMISSTTRARASRRGKENANWLFRLGMALTIWGTVGLVPLCAEAQESPAHSTPVNWLADWDRLDFWRTVDGSAVEDSWAIDDGALTLTQPRGGRGSLLSPPMPAHFVLTFEWRIPGKANSGVKYRVRQWGQSWLGVEYQIIDEAIPLPAPSKGSTASIYDLVAPRLDKPLHEAGQWNSARIEAVGNRLAHYLNGELVAETRIDTPAWEAAMARSKFYGREGFGQPREGDRIMVTDHGGQVAYRNFQLIAVEPAENLATTPAPESPPQLGNGMRNGWADQHSIVLWSRTTRRANYVTDGPDFLDAKREPPPKMTDPAQINALQIPPGYRLDQMLGACPGAAGEIRLTYFPVTQRQRMATTPWQTTRAESDFTAQWRLDGLRPGTRYAAIVEARPIGKPELTAVLRGHFQTAPPADAPEDIRFCLTTCHDFIRRDDGLLGHRIYPSMQRLAPHFIVHAGDIEYYDKPRPYAWTIDLMRFKWGRIFAMPHNREFYSNTTSYFIKDDHDTLKNDCWPGQKYGLVSFEEGQRLFNEEQFPSRDPRYMTVRWGRDIQIWVLEGRDYRSPNNMPDGPDKTILGAEQKQWLKTTLQASDATFKLVFTPTPIVGPDRPNKSDNHANDVFAHEGAELRSFFATIPGVLLFCGDRHWQYASVDPHNGLWEFGCGPGSAKHELGWKPGDVLPEHRFLRVQGGFLSGQLDHQKDGVPVLRIRHHDVDGRLVSEFPFRAP